jgi:superkiller protein 3
MGILSADDNLVDAALSELLALPIERRRMLDPENNVPYLLAQHQLAQGDLNNSLAVYQRATFTEPSHVGLRTKLAELTLQRGEAHAALAIAQGVAAEGAEDVRQLGVLRVGAAGRGGDSGTALQQAQKAVMATPWDQRAWKALAYARAMGEKA